MSREGRIQGRVAQGGQSYELVQYGVVRQTIPIDLAHTNDKLREAIRKNGWEPLP